MRDMNLSSSAPAGRTLFPSHVTVRASALRAWSSLAWLLVCAARLPNARAGNRVVAWGDLNYDITLSAAASPTSRKAAIAAGTFHSLALNNDGTVLAWGDDRYNQTNLP